ncbi:MAG: hypothetical protein J6A96_03970 [Clostridia bacterium]|nr:hypothetical protein [Clostridia bacterium]
MENLEKEKNNEVENNSTDEGRLVPIENDNKMVENKKDSAKYPIVISNDEEYDILLKTGEYYHDSENYPIDVRFKHPFMNIISLICGTFSCLCCVCAGPTPMFKIFAIFIFFAFFLSIIGTGLFIFDLIKSKTVNGLSLSGLIVSLLGGVLSLINLGIIVISFIVFDLFPTVANFVTTMGGGFLAIITTIVGAVLAVFI